ncbi:MAG TPA: S8 family serine peptidase, partial [Vicinamibacterales bacterium]
VIDSGVHGDHPHVGGVSGGIGIAADGRVDPDYVDRLGHGTAVAAVIREKAPAASIYCIKVFDRELAATGNALVAAIEKAIEQRVQIINLSLGTQNRDHEPALTSVVQEAVDGGAIVIAAGEQDGVRWLPGALPGVWPVMLDWTVPREECRVQLRSGAAPVFYASGFPRPIPGVPPERNLKGLSFAVANVTGLVAAAGAMLIAPQRD